jgi:hypothetical protein
MIGRREFGVAGLSAVALAALEGRAPAADKHQDPHGASEMFRDCAEACSDCQRECDGCSSHCARHVASGHKDHLTTLMTCQDCATFCAAAAQIVSRGGPFADLICGACAESCARCGKECEKFPDDDTMKRCAEECRKCEKACRDMIKHAKHGAK